MTPPQRARNDLGTLMQSRLKALAQVSNLVPGIIVCIAILVSLEPKLFGVEIAERQVVLALFALLGADAVIERTGRLYSLEKKIDALRRDISGPTPADSVLRTRSSFERMDLILGKAVHSITIVGINLEGAIIGLAP